MALSRLCLAWICSIIFASFMVVGGDINEEFDDLSSLSLEHSFDSGLPDIFTKRGTISIQSIKSGSVPSLQQIDLSSNERQNLKAAALSGSVYRVRVQTKPSAPDSYVSTFTNACLLYESNLSDILTLNVDQSGAVLGISISTTSPYCQGIVVPSSELESFNTTVELVQTATGPIPETQSYIQKIEEEKAQKAKGAQQDNRSFFAKYWMYIVPFVIFMMLTNAGSQEGGGGR